MTDSNTEPYVTLGDAARELGLVYSTLYAAWRSGRIPHQRAGSAILVKVSDVKEAMKGHRPRGTGHAAKEVATA